MKQCSKKNILLQCCLAIALVVAAQGPLVNTAQSSHAKLSGLGLREVHWSTGFWAERFNACKTATIPHLWEVYTSKDSCFGFENFRIAAGLDTGSFRGPSFNDGDFYKMLESVAALYGVTNDPKLDKLMDDAIAVIAKAQRSDGYVYTKSIIEQRQTGAEHLFDDHLSFEAYNFGHLMTAACVHYRVTEKEIFLNVAKRAADFLVHFYGQATPAQMRNAICPSHYMGIIEMYRTTGNKQYLALAEKLIDSRGMTEGTDDNSDRVPFRRMQKVNGHAVRANYLFAGVADLYAETGDTSLLRTLNLMWDDVVYRKMYITGGCGALYDGLSLEGLAYRPDSIQRIQQAYGKDYQLPNITAHNETCANIGNLLWNWRMLQLNGEAKYADIVELELYNAILGGVSMDGQSFFYTNPLASYANYPYQLRWSGGRSTFISKSNCCPPNAARTIAESANYIYSAAKDGLYVHLYGSNFLNTHLEDGSRFRLQQVTAYPWNGDISLLIREAPEMMFTIYLRIPGWCKKASLKVNGISVPLHNAAGSYVAVRREWRRGDKIQLVLDMPVTLVESNPLVEETRNQVAVKRGPLVYCMESADLQPQQKLANIIIPANIQLTTTPMKIGESKIMALEGEARQVQAHGWGNQLYRTLNTTSTPVKIKLIPYYAWANRGGADMAVWMPLAR